MLQLLIHFIIVSCFCIIWGLMFYLFPVNKKYKVILTTETILFSFFTGLAILSILSSWISIFFPIKSWMLPLLTLPLFIIKAMLLKKRWDTNFDFLKILKGYDWIFIICGFILFTFLSSGKPAMDDTDLYHVQTIRWIKDYGTVPGLANLYLRYGFYSNWFHAISLFELPFANVNFLYLNHTFSFWFFLFLYYQFKKGSNSEEIMQRHIALFYFTTLIFMLVEWDLFRASASSTTYDFVITATILLCLHLVIKTIVYGKKSMQENNILVLFFISLPFYKLTGFLILPLLIVFFILSEKKWKLLKKILVTGTVCIIPFLVKNYIQTGYLFFPYKIANLFHPEWKVPHEMVTRFSRYIYLGNHYINRAIPENAWTENLSFSYYQDWFLFLTKTDQLVIGIILVTLFPSFFLLKRIYSHLSRKIFLVYISCFVALGAWLLTSPDLRFAFGFLIFVLFFPISTLVINLTRQWMYKLVTGVFILTSGFYIYHKATVREFTIKNIIVSNSIDNPPHKQTTINLHNYNIPKIINNNWNARCYYCPLPCIYQVNPYLQQIGKEIGKGFKMKPYPDPIFIENYIY
jgi:hypothetical protein